MKTDHFAYHLTKYFADYLPNQLAASKNTIHSYRDTFVQLFEFYKEKQHISPEKLNYACFTAPRIEEFLTWLEESAPAQGTSVLLRFTPFSNTCNTKIQQDLINVRKFFLSPSKRFLPCRSITWIWKKPHCFFLFQIKAILHS